MITDPQGTVIALFLAFCRIGGCIMIMPGFSSARLPMEVRLFLSVALSMAVLPMVWDTIYPRVSGDAAGLGLLIASETLVGAVFGLIARLYASGLQFAGAAIAMSISFSGPPGSDVLEDSSESQLTSLLTLSGLLVLFMLNFHHIVIRSLVDSYTTIPLAEGLNPRRILITLTDTLSATFMIVLRLMSPFLIYGIMFNVAVGMINKMAPQIPVYFISTPYALMGGIFLLYLGIASMIEEFVRGFPLVFTGL
ncbi:flagellar type III secretion system protein FliR [Rhizobium sp. CFBP 8752]|jgi:flagellar biosynthetic protein FliR|uniref:flagellar biosynthetic protein FliR n=1 Tax=Rhizobium sp. CFBP 8752 TaxID=2775301 RepID=UPI00177B335C|nr:flagellar biosynthetic protein FliR [Rhizobium sp. CFBP 8752]MBD8664178.1 flagellar type III secretion system protein FliR [Rhizobium sp. CFBP 8752]